MSTIAFPIPITSTIISPFCKRTPNGKIAGKTILRQSSCRPLSEFFAQQLVNHSRIGFPLGSFHYLSDKPAHQRGFAGAISRRIVRIVGNYLVDNGFNGPRVGNLLKPFFFNDFSGSSPVSAISRKTSLPILPEITPLFIRLTSFPIYSGLTGLCSSSRWRALSMAKSRP